MESSAIGSGNRLARHERHDPVVPFAVREVELRARHHQRGAAGQHLAQAHAHERQRAIAHEREIGDGVPEQLERRIERLGVEAERLAVVGALIERQVVGMAVRTPRAAVEAARLRADDLEHLALAGDRRELAARRQVQPQLRELGRWPRRLAPPSGRGARRSAPAAAASPAATRSARAPRRCRCECP